MTDLQAIGADLLRVESVLSAPKEALTENSGLGTQQQVAVQDALEEFHDEWRTSVHQLIENIANWGVTSGRIAALATDTDETGRAIFDRLGSSLR
ncbi:hypothetical protein [Nocardia huaxiensis]|uniref:Uncharacterized protein n=1 Tax=Nocardia huaxiensis TaxID=2755382 RepID=A0A7D6ZSI6_9NOCA|nr:hypothetical protein [Nocardia huaxiensis]QLY32845.1 hypothetical protein H0264_11880 [Nocardia huaxiensis]UFS93400.1 hypothetical protein LPY97_21465 [Nocardia huaxiensis]